MSLPCVVYIQYLKMYAMHSVTNRHLEQFIWLNTGSLSSPLKNEAGLSYKGFLRFIMHQYIYEILKEFKMFWPHSACFSRGEIQFMIDTRACDALSWLGLDNVHVYRYFPLECCVWLVITKVIYAGFSLASIYFHFAKMIIICKANL